MALLSNAPLEAQLQVTLNVIPAYTWYASPSGALTFINARFANYVGLPKDHPLRFGIDTGAEWDSHMPLLHPAADHEEIRRVWSNCLRSGCAGEVSLRVRNAEGGYHWFLSRAEPLRASDGSLLYWIGVNLDIDDAKRAEQERETLLQSVIDRIPALAVCALPDGSLEFVNQAWRDYTDLQLKDLTGRGWQSVLHPDDLTRFVEEWDGARAAGKPFRNEARIRRGDGQYRWFSIGKVPLRDRTERIVRWLGTAYDIEERKQAEFYLAEGQRLAHMGSWAFNPAGFHYWSPELFQIFGLDVNGKAPTIDEYLALIHPEDRNFVVQAIQKVSANPREFDFTKRIVRPDGKIRHVRCVGSPVTHGDTFEGFVGTTIDVTEQEQLEQERERLRQLEADLAHIDRVSMMGEMAASLAHEIKQPIAAAITSAITCIRWLGHEPPNLDRARAAANRVEKDSIRAADIIDRLRSLYKKGPPQRELVDMNGIMKEMLTLLRGEAIKYSIAMRAEPAVELPKIMADRVQMQQVFMNLMLNAIEAMEDGGGELTLKSQLQNGHLLFSVTDTGTGLPTEKVDQIFSAFFTTKPQGSGMGLAISRSIIESHGGRLWATVNSGQGAIFHFTLPTEVLTS
jgi:PAS domain S-box-containing protein